MELHVALLTQSEMQGLSLLTIIQYWLRLKTRCRYEREREAIRLRKSIN